MQPPYARCICALLALAVFAGCQSVPERPLDLRAAFDGLMLRDRDLAVQPVQDYAAALAAARGAANGVFDPADGLSLIEAEAIALWYNPDLRIARLEAERAGALADATGRWADPEVGLGGGRKWFDGALDPSWIGSASLSITVPISGRTAAERRARATEHEAAMLAAAEAEWRMLLAVREAWIRWSEAVEQNRLLNDHIALVGPFAATAEELAQAGELDTGTARLFVIEHGRMEALRAQAALEEMRLRGRVMHLMGLKPEAPIVLLPEMQGAPRVLEEPFMLSEAPLDHPVLQRVQAEFDAAEARLRFELRKQYPDITISPSFEEERDESSVLLGFGFPIPVWNANRQGIAEALAQRELARARADAELQRLHADIAEAEATFNGARARRERLVRDVAPVVDRQIRESRDLIRSGELDMAALFQALTQAYTVKQELLEATGEEERALALVSALAVPRKFVIPIPLPILEKTHDD